MRFSSFGQARRWYLGSWSFPKTAEDWRTSSQETVRVWVECGVEVATERGLDEIADELCSNDDWHAAFNKFYAADRHAYREAEWRSWKRRDERKHPPPR